MRLLVKGSVIFLCVLLLASCSTRQLGYRYAETFISWQANRYVDLTREQDTLLREQANQFLQWHAEQHFPAYYQLLDEIAVTVRRNELSAADVDAYSAVVAQYWLEIRQQLIAPSVMLLGSLSDAQVTQLLEKMKETMTEREEEWQQAQAKQEDSRAERTLQTLRNYIGRPSREQQRMVTQWAEQVPDTRGDWLAYQQRWQAAFASALHDRHSDTFATTLADLYLHPEQFRDPQMQQDVATMNDQGIQLLLALQASLSDRQTTRLWQRLTRLQRDIAGMARQRDVNVSSS